MDSTSELTAAVLAVVVFFGGMFVGVKAIARAVQYLEERERRKTDDVRELARRRLRQRDKGGK